MQSHTLADLGWSASLQASFDSLNNQGLTPARVARAEREHYLLMHEHGVSPAKLAGKLRHQALEPGDLPVVGDWVAASMDADPRAEARVESVLPRRSLLTRLDPSLGGSRQPMAANADLVLLAAGLDLDFNPRRLERGAALARESGAEPVILLTKADLKPDCGRELSQVMLAVPGAEALAVSSQNGQSMDELRALLAPGVTAVLLGSSGAGKSTLVNRLLGHERQRTAEVRESDSRGRHATTHRELFLLPGGGLLMDTPGLRAFGLTGGDGMGELFPDIERFAVHCRYRDCRHVSEPGCAVKEALERGQLPAERYASFLKLRTEAEYVERRQAAGPDLETKRRHKELSKLQKRYARIDHKR